jgi:hypothetical protein
VRHARILALCFVALFAMSATSFVVASPAFAAKECDRQCRSEKEEVKGKKEEEKGKYSQATWDQYKYCPYNNPETQWCFFGRTSPGVAGGYFTVGDVKVPLSKPVTIQGGFVEVGKDIYGQTGVRVIPAANGGETLESPELPVEKGLSLITTQIQKHTKWPQALVEKFNEAKKNKEGGLDVKIEVAGNGLYESPEGLSTEALLEEEGPAFQLPLKTRLISPFLEKLGGGPCTVGNNEHPIMQLLTTERPGYGPTHVEFNAAINNIEVEGAKLVDVGWPIPEGAGASGCGGEYESYVDAAINETLAYPKATGVTELSGKLFTGFTPEVHKLAEKGERGF